MGRLRSFDVDDALRSAMQVFRARGYEGASLRQLETATGLNPGSLYNCFGSKEALFLAALDRYNETVVRRRIATYLKGDAPIAELRAMFVSTLHERGGTKFGCLLTNTAVEFGIGSAAVSAKVTEGYALLERAFAAQCERAKAAGSVRPSLDPDRVALRLLHAYQGLLVLVRFGRGPSELARLIDDLMTHIFEGAAND
jgi:TetR/AcrR family transcriptional repressor of nem operon